MMSTFRDTADMNHADGHTTEYSTSRSPYICSIKSMVNRYPGLDFLYEGLTTGPFRQVGRASVLEVQDREVAHRVDFDSPSQLNQYLERARITACERRIFILEGLPTAYIELIGFHLRIDPLVFACQQRTVNWEGDRRKGSTPLLPSRRPSPCQSFSLRFSELRTFQNITGHDLRCTNQERKVNLTRLKNKFDGTGMIRRKATFWSQRTSENGWNVLLLTDPPVGDVFDIAPKKSSRLKQIPNRPYHGGYGDFLPAVPLDSPSLEGGEIWDARGPSRNSLLDDICFYLQHKVHEMNGTGIDDPDACAVLLHRIVASNWMILIGYVKSVISQLEFGLSRRNSLAWHESECRWLDAEWSDLQTLNRRCSEYCEHIEETINDLNMLKPSPSPSSSSSSSSCGDNGGACHHHNWAANPSGSAKDFLYIGARMQDLRLRAERLSASFTGMIGICESKRSYEEARSVKTLTYLGMLFVPLAFTSSLFSMSDSYSPGGSHFWVFFAVSLPLILLIFALVQCNHFWLWPKGESLMARFPGRNTKLTSA